MTSPKTILLRGPNWVGDCVLAIPAMKAIREAFPEAKITLLVRPWVAGVFTSAPFVDKVWSEPRPSGVRDWMRLSGSIRSQRFDMAVLFPNSFESAAMVFLGRVARRVGYATDGRKWLLTDSLKPESPAKQIGKEQGYGSKTPERGFHQVDYYLRLAHAIAPQRDFPPIDIEATQEEKGKARKLLAAEGIAANRRFLVLNPGAAYGSAKRWGEERFAEAADVLAEEFSFDVAVVGSEMERSISENIRSRMRSRVAILNGKTSLETLIGVIAESSLVLTNDSGPMHLASALGVPTVAVFGSTDDKVTGPYGRRSRIVKEPVECSPCLLRECPIDHRCMTRVSAESVCRAARELLAASGSGVVTLN